jgi:hypothetical protein
MHLYKRVLLGYPGALGIIFAAASITAVQRTWHVRTQLRKEEQGAK